MDVVSNFILQVFQRRQFRLRFRFQRVHAELKVERVVLHRAFVFSSSVSYSSFTFDATDELFKVANFF